MWTANVYGQIDRSGFMFGMGIGSGFSQHAASYSVVEDTTFNIVNDFKGFRILVADIRVGWGFTPGLAASYNLKYSPYNTTISPYNSLYQGILIGYSPKNSTESIFSLGIGVNEANDRKLKLGHGILIQAGAAREFTPHFLVEANVTFGEMNNRSYTDRFLDSTREFSFQLTLNYLFYRG